MYLVFPVTYTYMDEISSTVMLTNEQTFLDSFQNFWSVTFKFQIAIMIKKKLLNWD